MSTSSLADSLVSSASRSVKLRVRPDLTARRHRYHGQSYWVLKEPVGLNYFRFHEEEYAILQMLDGHTSLEDIKEQFEADYPPQKITFQDLQQFIGMLHRSGLVISDTTGQGRQLKKRRDERKKKEVLGKFTNVFAIRFRGIDPERVLNAIYPYTGWFFSPAMLVLVVMLALSALTLVAVQFDEFQTRLPSFHEFFIGWRNWLYLAVVMALVKVFHEFGHGLTCKRYGGECHEMGFMLLVFTPALYCNVSDSWMLPNKWHRAFIGAAGIYVEMFLASLATFIWWWTEPGTMENQLALSTMFICSVSTIMFNGNPLLRFDGYYILMDILEIPNLRQKSSEVLKRFMVSTCLGIEQPENPFLPQRRRFLFGFYTVAAVIYRWVVVLGIMLFLNAVLEPYGLQILGRMVALMGIFGLVIQPLWKMGKFFYVPGRMHQVKRPRLAATIGIVAAVLLLVFFLPLPHSVDCAVEIRPGGADAVYVDTPGVLTRVHARPGDTVQKGDTLLEMDNFELRMAIIELEGRKAELEAKRRAARRMSYSSSRAGEDIDRIGEMIESVNEQLAEKREELQGLTLTAPKSGVVIPPPRRPARGAEEGQLPGWSGLPLEEKNQGGLLSVSDLICHVGDPAQMEAVLIIDQGDIELVDLVAGEPPVRVMLDALPGETFETQIDGNKIAKTEAKHISQGMSSQAGGMIDTRTDSQGRPIPISTSYQARVPMPQLDNPLCSGMRGQAKIDVGWQPLGVRFMRYLAQTFNFQL